MKQNRKTQKLLTLFRHRERDKWSDGEQQIYRNMQASEDSQNREDSILQQTQHELSQQQLRSATIQLYNMQLSYCSQIKLALTEYLTDNSSSNADEENHCDNYKSKCPSFNFSSPSVNLIKQHIKKANNYTLNDDSSNDAISTFISDSKPTHSQHPLANKLNDIQKEVFNIFQTFLNLTEENPNEAPYLVLLGGPGTGKSFVVKCLKEYYESTRCW